MTLSSQTSFHARLSEAVNRAGTALVLGLDPAPEYIPDFLLKQGGGMFPSPARPKDSFLEPLSRHFLFWSKVFEDYVCAILDLTSEYVGVVKVQSACYERLGAPGMAALARIMGYAREKGLLVIFDGKRGDVGSTAKFYRAAYLGTSNSPESDSSQTRGNEKEKGNDLDRQNNTLEHHSFFADALTLHPYLGMDSVAPIMEAAENLGCGVFVCVKTSNPGSGDLQDLIVRSHDGEGSSGGDKPLYIVVAEKLLKVFKGSVSSGSLAMVVGATYPEVAKRLRALAPETCFLVPGWGHQGGDASDLSVFFGQPIGKTYRSALFNVSRGIIAPKAYMGIRSESEQVVGAPAKNLLDNASKNDYLYKAAWHERKAWEEMIVGEVKRYRTMLATAS